MGIITELDSAIMPIVDIKGLRPARFLAEERIQRLTRERELSLKLILFQRVVE